MKKYQHITKYESILREQEELMKQWRCFLDQFSAKRKEYQELVKYYYSEQRLQDLTDDEENKIPHDLKRGVLSEDEIYNLMSDYHVLSIHLLEISLQLLKNDYEV